MFVSLIGSFVSYVCLCLWVSVCFSLKAANNNQDKIWASVYALVIDSGLGFGFLELFLHVSRQSVVFKWAQTTAGLLERKLAHKMPPCSILAWGCFCGLLPLWCSKHPSPLVEHDACFFMHMFFFLCQQVSKHLDVVRESHICIQLRPPLPIYSLVKCQKRHSVSMTLNPS